MASSKRKKRVLGLAAVFIVIIIADYQFRGTLHYKWLASVAAPLADTSLYAASDDVEFYEARIIRRIPHDPNSFVQGLQLIGDGNGWAPCIGINVWCASRWDTYF